jgi:uncharacterized membrane protein YqaE (UPF0057 family)
MTSYVVDEIYRQSRNVVGKREPKFVGFSIQDDNIEIDMEIAVPFLSVPKRRGVGSRSRNFWLDLLRFLECFLVVPQDI